MITNRDYYRKRLDEETRRATTEADFGVRHIHETMATMYRIRLEAEERGVVRMIR